MAQIKIIHLELEGEHYYFGSPKAMFDILGREKLGMSYRSFHSNIRLKVGEPYVNSRRGYIIRVGLLGQAKTNRNNKLGRERRLAEEAAALAAEQLAQAQAAQERELAAQQAAAEEAQQAAAEAKPAKRGKKKDKDVPEQLTLF